MTITPGTPGEHEVTVSFGGGQLTTADKVAALIGFGLADDTDEALAMLADMGEYEEA